MFLEAWSGPSLLLTIVVLLWMGLHWLQDVLEYIEGMREYDVPYHVRFAIDTGKAWQCSAANMPVCVNRGRRHLIQPGGHPALVSPPQFAVAC